MANPKKFIETKFTDTSEVFNERLENYDILRRHDLAMMQFCTMYLPYSYNDAKGIARLKDRAIPLVMATPRREYNEDPAGTTAVVWTGDNPRTENEQIPYPGCTLTRTNISFDQTRWAYTDWRKLAYSSDLNLVQVGNFPLPYTFMYQLDMWVDSHHDFNALIEQWARKFPRPTWWVDVEFPPPWDTQTLHMQADPVISNMSTFEGAEIKRDYRAVTTITLFGWIPLPTEWVRTVQKVTIDYIEESSQEILETFSAQGNKIEFWENGNSDQVLTWE